MNAISSVIIPSIPRASISSTVFSIYLFLTGAKCSNSKQMAVV
jgi:hypothetical protein